MPALVRDLVIAIGIGIGIEPTADYDGDTDSDSEQRPVGGRRRAVGLLRVLPALVGVLLALSASGCWWSSGGGGRGGQEAVNSQALEQLRNVARDTAWDKSLPMEKRVEAFEALRRSFPNGTPEELLVRYFDPESRTRLDEGRDAFVLRIVGPDGRERWLTIVAGKLSNDPKRAKE